jgi:enamine deaminase RidA (YjgF/YER057c/UK114 family)
VPGAKDFGAFDALSLAGAAQGAMLLSYAEAVCKAVGVPISNVVRAQYFLSDIREFAGIAAAWSTAMDANRIPSQRCKSPDRCRRPAPRS